MYTEEPFVTAAEQEIRQARFDGQHAQRMGCVDNQYCPDPVSNLPVSYQVNALTR